jgi:hypothetical protein
MASEPLNQAWAYPLFEALYGRRSRRFGLGFEMPEGPYRYASELSPRTIYCGTRNHQNGCVERRNAESNCAGNSCANRKSELNSKGHLTLLQTIALEPLCELAAPASPSDEVRVLHAVLTRAVYLVQSS